jgi:hypothetical protein
MPAVVATIVATVWVLAWKSEIAMKAQRAGRENRAAQIDCVRCLQQFQSEDGRASDGVSSMQGVSVGTDQQSIAANGDR